MRLISRCFCYLILFISAVRSSASLSRRKDIADGRLRVRVRRQDGYVYNKPSISFDLPSRSTTAPTSTVAPTVDRTLAQQMFYAYPAPAGGDTVNIGNTAGTTAGTTPAPTSSSNAGSGYDYRASTSANAGYAYGAPSTSGVQSNTASQVTNTAYQTAVTTTSQSAANTGTIQAGYGYNAPSPTLSPSLQGPSEASTSAPKYLPPTAGGSGVGNTVNIGGVSVTSGGTGSSTAQQTGANSVGTPSDTYLPPLNTNNAVPTGQIVTSTSTGVQVNTGGTVPVPSTSYLPPKSTPSPTPQPSPIPSSTPQPAVPAGGYIPPSNTGSVSTPANGYLPPGFF